MEPATGIEPVTYSLQNCCSTIEPRRRIELNPLGTLTIVADKVGI